MLADKKRSTIIGSNKHSIRLIVLQKVVNMASGRSSCWKGSARGTSCQIGLIPHFIYPKNQSIMTNLQDLTEHMLKDLYSAEDQMLAAYKEMADNADSTKLQTYFKEHIEATKQHKEMVAECCKELGISPEGETCDAMAGLVKEAKGFIKDHNLKPDVRDAGMIAQAQRIEHYEITGYGTLKRFAKELGLKSIESKLNEILDQEYAQDDRLTDLAEDRLNQEAKA